MEQIYRFNVGEFECISLNDGNGYGAAEAMFSNAPQELAKEWVEKYGHSPELCA